MRLIITAEQISMNAESKCTRLWTQLCQWITGPGDCSALEKGNREARPQAMLGWTGVRNLWHKLIGSEGCQNNTMFYQSGSYQDFCLSKHLTRTQTPRSQTQQTLHMDCEGTGQTFSFNMKLQAEKVYAKFYDSQTQSHDLKETEDNGGLLERGCDS